MVASASRREGSAMQTVTGYRVGNSYHLEPQGEDAEAVTVVLRADVRVGESAKGQRLLYRESLDYGMSLAAALALGWCWIDEKPP